MIDLVSCALEAKPCNLVDNEFLLRAVLNVTSDQTLLSNVSKKASTPAFIKNIIDFLQRDRSSAPILVFEKTRTSLFDRVLKDAVPNADRLIDY